MFVLLHFKIIENGADVQMTIVDVRIILLIFAALRKRRAQRHRIINSGKRKKSNEKQKLAFNLADYGHTYMVFGVSDSTVEFGDTTFRLAECIGKSIGDMSGGEISIAIGV